MIQNIIVYIILAVAAFFAVYKIFSKRKKKSLKDCESCADDNADCQPDYSGCGNCALKQNCQKIP